MKNRQKVILYLFIALFTYVNVEFYHCDVVYAGSELTPTANGSSKLLSFFQASHLPFLERRPSHTATPWAFQKNLPVFRLPGWTQTDSNCTSELKPEGSRVYLLPGRVIRSLGIPEIIFPFHNFF